MVNVISAHSAVISRRKWAKTLWR